MKISFFYTTITALTILQFQPINAQDIQGGIKSNSPTFSSLYQKRFELGEGPYVPSQSSITNLVDTRNALEREIIAFIHLSKGDTTTRGSEKAMGSTSSSGSGRYKLTVKDTSNQSGSDPAPRTRSNNRAADVGTNQFETTSNAGLVTTNNDTSSESSSSTSTSTPIRGIRALSTAPGTYLASTNFGENQMQVRWFNDNRWKLVKSVVDKNLPSAPPSDWQENFSISAAPRGPQLLVAWSNKLANVVRTLFYDGNSWQQTDFPTTHPVKAIHCNVSLLGSNAGVGFITQDPFDSNNLIANTVTRLGNTWSPLQEAIDTGNFNIGSSPRIRYGAGEKSQYFAWNSGNGIAVVCNSPKGGNWTAQTPVPSDYFDFGLSGTNDAAHFTTFRTVDSGANTTGDYYKVSPNKTSLFATSRPKTNLGMVENISPNSFNLGYNSFGEMLLGSLFDVQNTYNTTFSTLGSILFKPNRDGSVYPSYTQAFAPAGAGISATRFALNDLSSPVTTFANALRIVDQTYSQSVTSYVNSPMHRNRKYHGILTRCAEEFVYELLGTLSPADSLSRGMQYTTDSPQVGGTYTP